MSLFVSPTRPNPGRRHRAVAAGLLALLTLAPGSLRAGNAPATAAAATAPIQLEKFDVTADKEANFSLPLDAVATSGSRLGLSSRDLPASVSIITQEMMLLRGLRTAVEAVEAAVGMTGGTQFGSIPSYSTRGFGGNNVSVLRDGIRQNTASQSRAPSTPSSSTASRCSKGPTASCSAKAPSAAP
jgi:iron complex outermembrane receptor protein